MVSFCMSIPHWLLQQPHAYGLTGQSRRRHTCDRPPPAAATRSHPHHTTRSCPRQSHPGKPHSVKRPACERSVFNARERVEARKARRGDRGERRRDGEAREARSSGHSLCYCQQYASHLDYARGSRPEAQPKAWSDRRSGGQAGRQCRWWVGRRASCVSPHIINTSFGGQGVWEAEGTGAQFAMLADGDRPTLPWCWIDQTMVRPSFVAKNRARSAGRVTPYLRCHSRIWSCRKP